jgi:transcription elongation factor Elf1
MATVTCDACGRDVAIRELEAKTVAQPSGFDTRYRCPFCRADIDRVAEKLS